MVKFDYLHFFAPISGTPQKPAIGFSANLQTPSSASNVPIQKPAASIAQPTSLSFNAVTPQKPVEPAAPKPTPKSEAFGKSSASSFTPVDTSIKKPTATLTFGTKVIDEADAKVQSQGKVQEPAKLGGNIQTTPVKGELRFTSKHLI